MRSRGVKLRGPSKRLTLTFVDLELGLLILLAGATLLFEQLLPYTVIVVVLLWILHTIRYRQLFTRTPADWGISLLILAALVSLVVTALPQVTIIQVSRLLLGIAIYYAIIHWTNLFNRLRLLLLGFVLMGILLAFLGFFSVEWISGKIPFIPDWIYNRIPTLSTDIIHRNVMAGSLILIWPVLLGLLLYAWKQFTRNEKLLIGTGFIIVSSVLFLTQSRGAWLAASVVILIMVAMRWRKGWIFVILSGLIGLTLLGVIGVSPVLESISSNTTIAGIQGRQEIWSRAINMIQDFPITGIGMGSFGKMADLLYPFFLASPGSIPHAHNLYLQVAVDLGIPGLIGWLALLFTAILTAWQVFQEAKTTHNHWIMGLASGLFCSQIAMMVHGLVDATVWGMVRPAPLVWVLWGFIVACWQVQFLAESQMSQPQISGQMASEQA